MFGVNLPDRPEKRRPSEIARDALAKARCGVLVNSSWKSSSRLKFNGDILAIGFGAGAIAAMQVGRFLRNNPDVLLHAGNFGYQSVLAALDNWEAIALTHQLVDWVGFDNAVTILKWTGDIAVDNREFILHFIDGTEIALDLFDDAVMMGASAVLGIAVSKAFYAINRDHEEKLSDLISKKTKLTDICKMLEARVPASQLSTLLSDIPEELQKIC